MASICIQILLATLQNLFLHSKDYFWVWSNLMHSNPNIPAEGKLHLTLVAGSRNNPWPMAVEDALAACESTLSWNSQVIYFMLSIWWHIQPFLKTPPHPWNAHTHVLFPHSQEPGHRTCFCVDVIHPLRSVPQNPLPHQPGCWVRAATKIVHNTIPPLPYWLFKSWAKDVLQVLRCYRAVWQLCFIRTTEC